MQSLEFTLTNHDGKPEIYLTNDPALNQLTLKVTNWTDSTLSFTGGKPVPETSITDKGPTALCLILGDALSPEQVKGMRISAQGWTAQCFDGPVWVLTPVDNTVKLASKNSMNFTISNVLASGQARPGTLTIDYYNVPGISNDTDQVQLFIQNRRSSPKDLALISSFLTDDKVFVAEDSTNPYPNKLVFSLSNPSPTEPLVGADTPWNKNNPPIFALSFVCTTKKLSPGALCTAQQAANIEVSVAEQYTNHWQITKHVQSDPPFWHLTPQEHEVLGVGENATVEFEISNIITELDPGVTLMYLQYANIPGYNDGVLGLPLQKVSLPLPSIDLFSQVDLAALPVKPGDPDTLFQAKLAWATENAERIELSYQPAGEAPTRVTSDNGEIGPREEEFKLPTLLKQTTPCTLTAFNRAGGKDTKTIEILVVQPPRILSFAGQLNPPPLSDSSGNSLQITLSWQVTHATKVTLSGYEINLTGFRGSIQEQPVDPNRSLTITIKQSGTYTLKAYAVDNSFVTEQLSVQQCIAEKLQASSPYTVTNSAPVINGVSYYSLTENVSFDTLDTAAYKFSFSRVGNPPINIDNERHTGTWGIEDGYIQVRIIDLGILSLDAFSIPDRIALKIVRPIDLTSKGFSLARNPNVMYPFYKQST